MAERRNEVPFDGLETTGKKGKYFELKGLEQDPNLVVKEARTKWGFFEDEGVHPLNNLERTKEDLGFIKENFAEYVPDSNLVVGKNEKGKEVVYIVQHRIDGVILRDAEVDLKICDELQAFLEKVIKVYIKYLVYPKNSKEPHSIFPDVKGWNFIVGKDSKTSEHENRLYFVDTYPIEGSSAQDFIGDYINQIVKPTFPGQLWPLIDKFRFSAAKQINGYIHDRSSQIPRIE